MTTAQVNEAINKAKAFGDYAYNSIVVRTTGVESYRVRSDAGYGYFDDDNEVFVCVKMNNDMSRDNAEQPPIEVSYVDYADISKILFYIEGKDLAQNKSKFSDIKETDLDSLAKLALRHLAGGGFADPHKPNLETRKAEETVEEPETSAEEPKKNVIKPSEEIGHVSVIY